MPVISSSGLTSVPSGSGSSADVSPAPELMTSPADTSTPQASPAVVVTLSPAAKAATAAGAPPNFAAHDQVQDLFDRINNVGGAYARADQLDAFKTLHKMAVTGGLIGMGADDQKAYNAAMSSSSIGQDVQRLTAAYTAAMIAGADKGGASGARQAALDHFNALDPSDQEVLLDGNINAADMSGASKHPDVDSWRDAMAAGVKLDRFVEAASAKGDPYQLAKSNPKLATALTLSGSSQQDAGWVARITDLLGQDDPAEAGGLGAAQASGEDIGASLSARIAGYGAVLAEGSKASDADKMSAFTALQGLSRGADFAAAGQADRDALTAATRDSAFAKRVAAATDAYSSKLNGNASASYVAANTFGALSDLDQQMVFVGMGYDRTFGSIADAKAAFQATGDSKAARAAADARSAAMTQADAATFARAGANDGGVVGKAKRLAAILADDSGASKADKIQAYLDLWKTLVTDSRDEWFAQSTRADRDAVGALMNRSGIAQEIQGAADDLNRFGMSQNRQTNVPRANLARINAMSEDEQRMVYAGMAASDYPSLDAWKAQMAKDIEARDQQLALDEAEKTAKASGKAAALAPSDADKALAILTSDAPAADAASAALKTLRDAAEARAAQEASLDARGQSKGDELKAKLKDASGGVSADEPPIQSGYAKGALASVRV